MEQRKGKPSSPIKNLRTASAERGVSFSKNGPGPARNPAPCVYDPTGATSLKTRYSQTIPPVCSNHISTVQNSPRPGPSTNKTFIPSHKFARYFHTFHGVAWNVVLHHREEQGTHLCSISFRLIQFLYLELSLKFEEYPMKQPLIHLLFVIFSSNSTTTIKIQIYYYIAVRM